MAEVFLAKQIGTGGFERLVVLKRALPQYARQERFRAMFLEEARVAADLRHPNVVHVTEVVEHDGALLLVMEFLHGQDLSDLIVGHIARHQAIPLPHALQIILDAAAGLHYAHTKVDLHGKPLALVHRDISPQNIVVTYNGITKIVDFGIAKAIGRTLETAHGTIKGKLCYMSPEQAQGERLDHRSDQFALGVVLWELIARRPLFRRESDALSIHAVVEADVPPLREMVPGVDDALDRIVTRMLSRVPEDRYPDLGAVMNAVEDYLESHRMVHSPRRVGRYLRRFFDGEIEDDSTLGNTTEGGAEGEDITELIRPARPATRVMADDGSEDEDNATVAYGVEQLTQEMPYRADADTMLRSGGGSGLGRARINLATPEGAFLGRGPLLAELHKRVHAGARLISLVGAAGIGKSRLAIEYGHRQMGDYTRDGGVWRVDLRSAHTAADVVSAVASALGIAPSPDAALAARVDHVGDALAARGRTLLILDAFEHLAVHAELVLSPWLRRAEHLRLLVTSRQVLRTAEEVALEVGPLEVPGPDDDPERADAVQLMIGRIRDHDPERQLAPDELRALAEVARRLDGVPLALELAAARLRELSCAELLGGLGDAEEILSLAGAVRWSWDVLPAHERDALTQLCVFEGTFDLDGAEAVAQLQEGAPPMARLLESLRDRSLIHSEPAPGLGGEVRHELYRAVRAHARPQLRDLRAWARHAAWITARGTELAGWIDGPGGQIALRRLRLLRADLIAVADRELEGDRSRAKTTRALRALCAAEPALGPAGDAEVLSRLDRALDAAAQDGVESVVVGLGYELRADMKKRLGDHAAALADYDRALAEARREGSAFAEAVVLRNLASVRVRQGQLDLALRGAEEAERIFRHLGDRVFAARATLTRARALLAAGEMAHAREACDRALSTFRHVGDRRFEGRCLSLLGDIARREGARDNARHLLTAGASLHRQMGEAERYGRALLLLADVLDAQKDADARRVATAARKTFERLGDLAGVATAGQLLERLPA
jgi:serine/threonine protein kinase/predicted ATPase